MPLRPPRPALIAEVVPDSPAARAGLLSGDRVVSANGVPLTDVIEYQFAAADGMLDLRVERGDAVVNVSIEGDEPPGIVFAEPTFDGIRTCTNKCPFCFVTQNPHGARRSLFVKDDDWRYSVLYGGFVTLTNFSERDWERIAAERIARLNVSVHATELELRRVMLGSPRAPDVLDQIRRLIGLGVTVNAQVVLCPGMNDGQHLDRTIDDLVALYPGVAAVSVVPVGLTDNGIRPVSGIRRYTPEECAVILRSIAERERALRRRLGVGFVYASDEFYLLAGAPIPGAVRYDGFPQYANGVGMVRSLLDEASGIARRRGAPASRYRKVTVVTGVLAEPIVRQCFGVVARKLDCQIDVVGALNGYFGPSVTVAGLLTGGDIISALRGRELGEVVLAARCSLDAPGERFLDDATPATVESALDRPIRFAGSLREAVAALTS